MTYSDRFIDVAFGDSDLERLLSSLNGVDTLSAAALLTAMDGESEDVFQEAFAHLEDMGIKLDLSDLPKAAGVGEAAVRLRREEQLAKRGDLLHGLEKTDPLRLYLEELALIPVCGDIRLLARQLAEANRRQEKNDELRTTIVNLSLSRVVELACECTGYGVLLLDLIQEGSMGLWQSLTWYETGDFEEYRDWWICQSMAKAVTLQAHSNGVGQKMRRAMEDYRSVDEKLLTELGRNPTIEEIAEEMRMSVQETAMVSDMLENARNMNRAKAETEPKPEEPDDEQAVEDTAYFQMRQRIAEMLSGLNEADAELLTLRFGLEGGLPLSPEDTGKRLGLTPEEVVEKEAAALTKLRKDG